VSRNRSQPMRDRWPFYLILALCALSAILTLSARWWA
jgi:hypothetical protein